MSTAREAAFPLRGAQLSPHVATLARLTEGDQSHSPKHEVFSRTLSEKERVSESHQDDASPILWTRVMQLASRGAGRTVAWTPPTGWENPHPSCSSSTAHVCHSAGKGWKRQGSHQSPRKDTASFCPGMLPDFPTAEGLTHRVSWKIIASWDRQRHRQIHLH